jgi:hypothetical protein
LRPPAPLGTPSRRNCDFLYYATASHDRAFTRALDILVPRMDDPGTPLPPPEEHAARVQKAFDAFHEKVGERLDDKARDTVERLRAAAAEKDAEKLREHLGEVKERHGWLYRELAEHPAIATLLDELALWGF